MKSKQYAKRLLSLIIASVMILTMLPVSALAAGTDDVMIEDQAETIVEEAADVSGEVVEEAAEVPDIEESEDAVIVEESVDEIAEADSEELAGDSETRSFTAQGVPSGSKMRFNAQLTGLTVSAVVPATRAAKGSVMTADIVDVSAYEDAIAKKNYGKSITGLYGLELHFYDKKGKPIKHINTSDITVTVDGLEASSYFIGSIENNVKTLQRGTEPKFTITAKKAYTNSYAYTYVIAGLRDDGLVRAFGEADGDGNKRFNLNDENVNIEVVAPEDAFADGVAMEASDVTNGTTLGAEDGDDALVGASSDEVVAAYEISFYNEEGDEQQPSKEVTVSVNVPLDVTKGYELIHIADDGTRNTVIGAKFTENGVEFKADSFSVYAVVLSSNATITSGQEYVIYSGTGNNNALAYNGGNLTNETVTVHNNTTPATVDFNGDNIKWTFTSVSGGGYRISYTNGNTTYYLYSNNNYQLALTSNENNATTWYYDSSNNRLSLREVVYGNYYWTYYVQSLTGNRDTDGYSWQAATINLALVTEQTPTADMTYHYYAANGTASSTPISASETKEEGDLPTSWTDVSTLAKEIDGYHFLEARANAVDGHPITQVNGKHYRKGDETSGNGDDLNSIYFIYMKNFVASSIIDPELLEGPGLAKTVTDNGDGTFKIRLNITGKTNKVEHGANVVVVFDKTYSMRTRMNDTNRTRRIDAAISAVNKMVATLNPGTEAGQHDIDFALVEFDRTAAVFDFGTTNGIPGHTNWTKKGAALTGQVGTYANGANLAEQGNNSGTTGGTNWQEALQKTAAVLEDKPDNDVTYVVFMTDGAPTIFIDTTRQYPVHNGSVNTDPEYTKAVPYAKTIVDAGYNMWDIFCSDDDTALLEELYNDSDADEYVKAEVPDDVETAFVRVAQAMLDAISSQNNAANDGVPKMGSFDLTTVDGEAQLENAKYYITRYTENDQGELEAHETVWTDAPPAQPSDAGVKWDLSSKEPLEDGTVYSVEFDIWPSQDAYDLIADLNNGVRSYGPEGDNPISPEERAQVKPVEDHPDQYTMKTNTSLNMSYDLNGEHHSEDIPEFPSDDMELPTETITIEKIWPSTEVMNQLDNYGRFAYRGTDGEVHYADKMKLTLWRGDVAYLTDLEVKAPTATPTPEPGNPGEVTEDSQVWDNQGIKVYISCGNMVEKDGVVTVHETGHDYRLTEPEEFSYFWDLMSDTYHPMVINGVTTMLAEVDSHDVPSSMPDDNNIKYVDEVEEDGTVTVTVYYRFNNKVYKVTSDTNCVLQGTNYRRSNLNLTKTISEAHPMDDYFEYEAVVTSSTNEKIWFSATTTGPDAETPVYYMGDDWVISGSATRDIDSTTNQPTGYWYADSGATIKFKIKDGWNVRFLNLYHGSTFSFQEIDNTTDNYVFDSVEAANKFEFMNENIEDDSWYSIDADHITGTIVEPNNRYTVTYKNTHLGFFYVYHSSDCSVERFPMSVNNVLYSNDNTFNINALTAEGTLYGGYYSDYAGKSAGFDATAAAALDYSGEDAPKDVNGKAYDYAYIKNSSKPAWNYGNGYNVDGSAMVPQKDTVYYLKEVPDGYLRPYTHYTYYLGTLKIGNAWAITGTDDLCYKEAGFMVRTKKETATIVASMTIAPKNNSTSKVTLTAGKVFKPVGVLDGWLGYAAIDAYIDDSQKTVIQQFWETKDGIRVFGVMQRELTFAKDPNGYYTKSGITKNDTDYSAS